MGARPGDIVRMEGGRKGAEGVLMPRHEFTSKDIIVVKLKNGYNIGLRLERDSKLVLMKKGIGLPERSVPKVGMSKELPAVKLIGTGGTIASYVDYKTGAVHPALKADELVASAPELADICNIDSEVLYSILSEDMTVEYWQNIAEHAFEALKGGAAGVVIAHGTDTMAFTAAAVSFMLPGLNAPVVLTGSQRSSDRPSSDARANLLSAARLAAYGDLGEVAILMHSGSSDDSAIVHRGTRARKMHSTRRDAFRTMGGEPIGTVGEDGISLTGEHRGRGTTCPELKKDMDDAVGLVYAYPGMHEKVLGASMDGMRGIVIAGTGLGHLPSKLLPSIEKFINGGGHAVMTTQCLGGAVNLSVYSNGRALARAGVIEGTDMLPEVAWVKLMWVLGQKVSGEKVGGLMASNLAGEMSERRVLD
ncbi:MAG: Glu-tRNA(Gln) amidotransferase subunit GatD [Euryarchaeota archaeon]|nr:Glu-tRNA(Gln) amidotransferase subunit GatD [Euryarchaeota archaeon]